MPPFIPPALHAEAQAWLQQGRDAWVVRIDATRGSVPRNTGTRMLVDAEDVVGTIGGGHLELEAIRIARARLRDRMYTPHRWDVTLGPQLGQCCGGALTLHFEHLTVGSLAAWPVRAPRFVLQLYGAGHVGRAVVKLLADLPCHVSWIDERELEFPSSALPPHIEKICVDSVVGEVAIAPPQACYLVMTHNHALDGDVVEAVLKRGDAAYLGMIGSATKKARLLHRLEARGHTPAALAQLHCPIGVPGISGKTPELIAVATVAQLLLLPIAQDVAD